MMRTFLIALSSFASGILLALLISMVVDSSRDEPRAERSRLLAELDSLKSELSTAQSRLDAEQQLSQEARRQISVLEHELATKEKRPATSTPVAKQEQPSASIPVAKQAQPPASRAVSAAEKRFAAALVAYLDYQAGTVRLLDETAFLTVTHERSNKSEELYAAIPEPPQDTPWAEMALKRSLKLRASLWAQLRIVEMVEETLSLYAKDAEKAKEVYDKAEKQLKEFTTDARKEILEIRNLIPPDCLL